MCLWCEVELRVYRSYADQERQALEAIRRIEREAAGSPSAEESSDRRRCLWEKKLEYVIARLQRERLAVEMQDAELCDGGEKASESTPPRRFPDPAVPAHLLTAFERYVEVLFHRLTRPRPRSSPRRRADGKLLPFEPPTGS